jgi:hypothetical protein
VKEFTTKDGRLWRIIYDLPTVKRIRDSMGIDLLTREGLQQTCGSILDFATVLYVSIKPQADSQGIAEEDFLRSLEGAHELAVDAWLAELEDFFRRVGKAGLANLAGATVRLTREDERTTNELFDRSTADRLVTRGIAADRATRRSALARLLGDDLKTPGSPSGNSELSPASTLRQNM